MDLTRAEAVLVGLVRGEAGDFHMTIAANGGRWLTTLSSSSDGLLAGTGNSFGEAMGADAEPGGDPGDGETAPAVRALHIVAGTDHRSERKVA